jgi:hypothetical protein
MIAQPPGAKCPVEISAVSAGRNSSGFLRHFIKTSQRRGTIDRIMNQKNLLPILLVPSCILIIPATAMLLKAEGWAWNTADFVIVWIVVASAMAAYRLVATKAPNRTYRVATGVAVIAGVILMWINGAVGLIGNENNPANLMYGGVLAVGLLGAAIARLRPLGMAWALLATAFAQFLVPVIAVIIWRPDFSPGVVQVFILNFCFVLLFAGSALLFRRSATSPYETSLPMPV